MVAAAHTVVLAGHGSDPAASIDDKGLLVLLAAHVEMRVEVLKIGAVAEHGGRLQMHVDHPASRPRVRARKFFLLPSHQVGQE